MVSRDYTKEIGASTGDRSVPLPIALIILVALAAAGWFLLTQTQKEPGHTGGTAKAVSTTPVGGESGN
jgi:hypothetical protein